MNDTILLSLVSASLSFIAIYLLSGALNFVVALKSPPDERALWTVGIPYALLSIVASGAILLYGRDVSPPFPIGAWEPPLLVAPGAIVMFLLRRWGYRSAWIDDEKVTEDIKLANDDWKVGLFALLAFVTVVTGRALLRVYLRS